MEEWKLQSIRNHALVLVHLIDSYLLPIEKESKNNEYEQLKLFYGEDHP